MMNKKFISILLSISICISCLAGISFSVFADDGENIALNKPVKASSQWDEGGVPENVVDGNNSNYWARGSITLEGKNSTGGLEFIMIDLLDQYVIEQVNLWIRANDTLKGCRLDFSNSPDFSSFKSVQVVDANGTDVKGGVANEYKINLKDAYRYVRAVNTQSSFFILSEIQIYGEAKSNAGDSLFKDVKGTEYEGAVKLLKNIGAVEGISEEEYGLYQYITRGQAVDSVVKTFSEIQRPGYNEESPFFDVSEEHPLYASIYTAYKLGYVKGGGDGYFNPDDYISPTELSIMVLRALGYGVRIEAERSPEIAANQLARNLHIFKSVKSSDENYVTRGDFAEVLYNAVIAPQYVLSYVDKGGAEYRDGKSILEEKYDIILNEDVVFENRYSTFKNPTKDFNDIAYIGETEYKDPNGTLDDLLGRKVVVAVPKSSQNEVLYAWVSDDSSEITIKADDLASNEADVQSGRIIVKDDNGKEKKYNVSSTADYVFNDIAYPEFTAKDALIKNGTLVLVDNNDDGVYDVVFINSYEMYYVTSTSYMDEKLYFKGEGKTVESFVIDDDGLIVVNEKGAKKTGKALKSGSVVAVYGSKDKKKYTIKMLSKAASGKLTEVDGENVYIDSVKFETANDFKIPDDISLGDTVDIYVNDYDEIVYMKRPTKTENNEWTVGFCSNYSVPKSGFGNKITFKMYTEKGVFEYLSPTEKITLDGSRIEIERIVDIIKNGKDLLPAVGDGNQERYLVHNFWRYKLNSDGEIVAIDSVNYDKNNEIEESFSIGGRLPDSCRYTSAGCGFYKNNEFIIPARNTAIAFTIPTVNGEYTSDSEYDRNYSIGKLTSIVADKESAITDVVNYYMPDEYGFPAYFSKCKDFAASGNNVVTKEASPYMLVSEVGEATDAEGLEMVSIKGYNLETKKEINIAVDAESKMLEVGKVYQDDKAWFGYGNVIKTDSMMKDESYESYFTSTRGIKAGDILRYQAEENTDTIVERAFEYNPNNIPKMLKTAWFDSTGGYTTYQFAQNRFQYGRVYDANAGIYDIQVTHGEEGAETVTHEKYPIELVSGLTVFVCHERGITKETGSSLYAYIPEEYRVISYSKSGAPSCEIIYKYNIN